MDNGMARKVEKAKKYANDERDRITLGKMEVNFEGTNNNHSVKYLEGKWNCDCDYFIGRDFCCHTLALEMILEDVKMGALVV